MRRFGLYRKYLSRTAGILGAFFLFCFICRALNYIYVSFSDTNWERILWHNFYEDGGTIDNLYLGSSHVHHGVNPTLLDDMNGEYNFNLSSDGQLLNGSYYMLKEADKNNELSHVYLELYYYYCTKDNFNSDKDVIDVYYSNNWKNTDCMRNSYNQFRYRLSIAGTEKYIDIFFPFSRYRTKLGSWDYIKKIMDYKRTNDYLNYEYHVINSVGKECEYQKQGYYYVTREFRDEQRSILQDRVLTENPIGEKSERYLRKIISYCQKSDIPITLFIIPIDELRLISTEYYDNYINQVRKIAGEYNVDFYDFNLAKEEYLDIQHGKYFCDVHHLNCAGADMFTAFFSDVVSKVSAENEKYFYTSYAEKLQSINPAIYGLYYRDSDGFRTYHIASNRESGMEYRITLNPAPDESGGGTEQLVIQDYSENKEFTLPVSEHGSCTIEARLSGEERAVQTLTVNY